MTVSLIALMKRVVAAMVLIALAGTFTPLSGQQTDSIAILLSSSSIRDRSEGVEWLLSIPQAQWPSPLQTQLVSLLTQEGETMLGSTPSAGGAGEVAGHYHISLVRAALLLNDPATLRGMVTLGMKVSGRAKQFVASRGEEALPELRRAYEADAQLRVPVVQVLGVMLTSGHALSEQTRRDVNQMLLGASGYELSFLRNAGLFPQFYGAVAWAADSAEFAAEREQAAKALPDFTSRLGELTAAELWRREMALLELACGSNAQAHCQSAQNVGRTAQAHLDAGRSGPARNTVNAVLQQLTQACGQAEMPAGGCRVLIPGAKQVLAKLP